MEKILNQKNDIKNCVIKNEDNISYVNSHNSKEKETKYQSQKTNSLYDKIKSQRSSQKKLVSFEKKYFNQKLNSQKELIIKIKKKKKIMTIKVFIVIEHLLTIKLRINLM